MESRLVEDIHRVPVGARTALIPKNNGVVAMIDGLMDRY
jgi:hypothetical protein